MQDNRYDHIIVGGGAAGCVLAGRLSEDPAARVLLLEAGPDFAPGSEPDWVNDARFRAHYDAAIFSPFFTVQTTADRRSPYRQPRLIGGGSAVNGMHAQRGFPADYDGWADHGITGWAWRDVLPFFRKLESDADFTGQAHGALGPIPIARVPDARWSRLSLAMRSALEREGVPRTTDFNDATGDGVGPVPLNIAELARVSAAAGYLTAEVRRRPNLTVRGRSGVRRILFRGQQAVGVDIAGPDGPITFHGDEIIVSTGVYQSPALLLRSGIGPGEALSALGIALVADRAGVGRVLRNHAQLPLTVHLRPKARQPDSRRPPCAMIARYTSGLAEAGEADMLINLWERIPGALADDPLSRQFAMVMVLMNKAFSEGSVTLDPADPFGAPRIDCNALGDPRDLDRMVAGLRHVADLLASPEMAPLVNEAFFAVPDRLMRTLMAYGKKSAAFSRLGALALSAPRPLRRRLLRTRGPMLADVLRDDASVRAMVLAQIQPSGHGTATCRMGAADDPLAVTDSRCRVIGVEGLRVVDGSIFPDSPHAGTHLPIIMAAEKAAAMIAEERGVAAAGLAA